MNGIHIHPVTHTRHLGVMLDTSLSLAAYINPSPYAIDSAFKIAQICPVNQHRPSSSTSLSFSTAKASQVVSVTHFKPLLFILRAATSVIFFPKNKNLVTSHCCLNSSLVPHCFYGAGEKPHYSNSINSSDIKS